MPEAEVRDVRLYYESRGEGEPLLCLPGALGTCETDFGPQLADLSVGYRVIAPDPRGYGKSRPPERDFPLDFFQRDADDMAALMTVIGHQTFNLAGWSDGANSAMLLAITCPERVRRLVIWGGSSCILAEDIELFEKVRDLSTWSARMLESLKAIYGASLQHLWNTWCDVLQTIFRANGEICRQRLHLIRCPTFILHGAQDPLLLEEQGVLFRCKEAPAYIDLDVDRFTHPGQFVGLFQLPHVAAHIQWHGILSEDQTLEGRSMIHVAVLDDYQDVALEMGESPSACGAGFRPFPEGQDTSNRVRA